MRTGARDLPYSQLHEMHVVGEDTPINELFEASAQHLAPLVVVDEQRRVKGVVPRVTLLAAAASAANGDSEGESA